MTVEDQNTVDFVAAKADLPIVRLVISDHLHWEDELAHLAILQQKLNRYLAFVESGELVEKYPQYEGYPVEFEIAFRFTPTRHACEHFLKRAQEVVRSSGLDLRWNTRSSD